MKVSTKNEVTFEGIKIPKKTMGTVVGHTWGLKEGYIINFPQASSVFLEKGDVMIEVEVSRTIL